MILEELVLYTVVTQFEIFAIDPLASCGTRSISGVLSGVLVIDLQDYRIEITRSNLSFRRANKKGRERKADLFHRAYFPGRGGWHD